MFGVAPRFKPAALIHAAGRHRPFPVGLPGRVGYAPLMLNSADARRRWFGALFLILAVGMVIWGQTLLKPHLQGAGFLLYWFGCFVATTVAIAFALLDLRALRRHGREAQQDLLQHTLDQPPGDPAPPSQKKD